jgi:hypothetical protein
MDQTRPAGRVPRTLRVGRDLLLGFDMNAIRTGRLPANPMKAIRFSES